MAITAKQRQKKLEKKNAKRVSVKKSRREVLLSKNKASAYAGFPIHECLVPKGLFELGIGNVIVTRRTPDDAIAVSAFLVDVQCLGVKDALFRVMSEYEYESDLKARLIAREPDEWLDNVDVACVKKLIDGAIGYAGDLGFTPHRDYQKAKGIFDDVDADACPVAYVYGKDGKPFYMRGPNESIARAKAIVDQLKRKCGEDNYDGIIILEP
ncbi:MAG: hypothetical protein KJO08_09295 [Gammaproteobacteria bacterium]|nr:hypothetical protein [Gammaproteobacteria bacterium]NNJ84900.1 hypothetical protein [Gammaproteobacteria bacterium]